MNPGLGDRTVVIFPLYFECELIEHLLWLCYIYLHDCTTALVMKLLKDCFVSVYFRVEEVPLRHFLPVWSDSGHSGDEDIEDERAGVCDF